MELPEQPQTLGITPELQRDHVALVVLAFTQLTNRVGTFAREKGWRDQPRGLPEEIALMHSELSEALECYRKGEPELWVDGDGKPEGVISEMADVIIRILDAADKYNWPLGEVLLKKQAYNESRPYRHGGKKA